MKTKRKILYKPDASYVGEVFEEINNKGQVRVYAAIDDVNPHNRFGVDLVIPHSFLKIGDNVEITVKKLNQD